MNILSRVKYQFTAYVIKSLERERDRYIKKLNRIRAREIHLDSLPEAQQEQVLSFSYSGGYPSAQSIPFRTLQAEIVDKHLLRSLDQLTELEQQVLTAKYIWDMRNTEAADYLGISSDAVRHAEHRAMRKLQMKLKASV